ncbi:MAG: sensor histidine kinase [Flavihumibacter sp.]
MLAIVSRIIPDSAFFLQLLRLPLIFGDSMLKYFLLLCCLPMTLPGRTQSAASQADSLIKRLHITSSYDDKIELLGNISDIYSYTDSAKAVYYAMQLLQLAEEKKDERGKGIASYRLGGAYLETVDLDKAEQYYQAAENILAKDSSDMAQGILARTWANHGLIYQRRGNNDRQLKILLEKVIPINQRLNDSARLGKNYHSIGLILQNIKEYRKAIDYFQQSRAVLQQAPWVPEVKDNYVKIAESMIYIDAGMQMRDSVLHLLEMARALLQQYPDPLSETMYLQTMGIAAEYFDSDVERAGRFYEKAIELADKYNLRNLKAMLLSRQYYVKEKQEKYGEALAVSRLLHDTYKDILTPSDKLLQLKHMMEMEERLGNTGASLALHKAYIVFNDSIQTANTSVKVQELEQQYAAKEKETQIIRLNQVAQEQQLQIQKNRLWMYLLAAAVLFLIGFYIARQIIARNKHKIAVQESELLQQRIEKMKQEQQISHFAAMLEGQEQERKRLAIDLHDGLGGSLSAIRLKMSKIIGEETQATGSHNLAALKAIAGEMDRSINDLRHIARNMMPEALLKYGLVAAIKDFCKRMESDAVAITFQSYDVPDDLPQPVQIMVFRIFQEAITNAVKHANARHIHAQCLQQNDLVSITIEDDGRGFDTNAVSGGVGLSTLRSRVNFLGGRLDIQSEPGVGTTVNIEFITRNE